MILAVADAPTFFQWALVMTWVAMYFVVAALVCVLIIKNFRVLWRMEVEAARSAEDRKLVRELLETTKRWALLMDRKDENKETKLAQVAELAATSAAEMKTAVAAVPDQTAERVAAIIQSGDSAQKLKNVGGKIVPAEPNPE